jgi:hypothetical protein
LGIVGCYDLNLYCDGPQEECPRSWNNRPGQFSGANFREAMAEARRAGWVTQHREAMPREGWYGRFTLCPTCAKRGKGKANA